MTIRPAPDLLKKQFPLIGENLSSGVVTMRTLLILAAIIGVSVSALAQTAAPKHSGKPLKQAKPKAPMACKLVGTVKGTKLGPTTVRPHQNFGIFARRASADPRSKSPGCQTIVASPGRLGAV